RAHTARARGAGADGRGPDQRRHLAAAVHQRRCGGEAHAAPVREARPQRGRERAPPCDGGADAAGELSRRLRRAGQGWAGQGRAAHNRSAPLRPGATVPPHRPFIHNMFDDDHRGRNSLLSGPKILLEQRLPPYRGTPFPHPKAPLSTPDRSSTAGTHPHSLPHSSSTFSEHSSSCPQILRRGWRAESNVRTVVDMESTTPQDDRGRPGDESRRAGDASSSADVLTSAASALAEIEASPAARVVLAQVLSATLLAFTRTRSVRDPLPDTAADSPEEVLAVLAGIDHLRSSLSAMDA